MATTATLATAGAAKLKQQANNNKNSNNNSNNSSNNNSNKNSKYNVRNNNYNNKNCNNSNRVPSVQTGPRSKRQNMNKEHEQNQTTFSARQSAVSGTDCTEVQPSRHPHRSGNCEQNTGLANRNKNPAKSFFSGF